MEFKSLGIIEPILRALEEKGYISATPIQGKTIPLLLEGSDVIGIAQTGTGKTAAFSIPILQKLNEKSKRGRGPRALVLAPTRELAAQIVEEFKSYGKFLNFNYLAIYGGVGIVPQIKTLERGVDVLIATPGRLLDLMNQGKVDLKGVNFLVLDEADRMLDMGFVKDIKKVVKIIPEGRQTLFFSATMSKEILELTDEFLNNPKKIEVTPESTPVDKIEQCVFFIDRKDKEELLLDLIKQQKMDRVLVFVGMKHKANKVAMILNKNGVDAVAIHGNKSQFQREKALREFKCGAISVLVATDIAARGIDVDNISHVINYDLPNEPENYVHRIGRTARAGNEGVAYSFCSAEERNYLNQIERVTKRKIEHAKHKWHSLDAKNAEGIEAKPKPRTQGIGRGRGRDKRKAGGGRGRGRGNVPKSKVSGSKRVAMGRTRSRR
jgi:ATP-dependent RNA helicase RhlE